MLRKPWTSNSEFPGMLQHFSMAIWQALLEAGQLEVQLVIRAEGLIIG